MWGVPVIMVFCVAGSTALNQCSKSEVYKKRASVRALVSQSSLVHLKSRWEIPLPIVCMSKCNEGIKCRSFQIFENETCELIMSKIEGVTRDEKCTFYSRGELGCPNGLGDLLQADPHVLASVKTLGSCYKHITETMSWTSARERCLSVGGHLVSIESREEQEHLKQRFTTPGKGFWTSGSDAQQEGHWVWNATGKPLAKQKYINWANNEPNNLNEGEEYLAVWYSYGSSWNDAGDTEPLCPVCETSAIYVYP